VTEEFVWQKWNGAAFADTLGPDGRIHDGLRIDYLRGHIAAAERARDSGIPLRGYFVWTLMDNFEWAHGYDKRFGLVAVDRASGKRTKKDSFYFYRDVISGFSS